MVFTALIIIFTARKPCNAKTSACLFDLESDPCEQNNLAEDMPDVVDRILKRLNNFKPGKPLNKPYDPRAAPNRWHGEVKPWCDVLNCEVPRRKNFNRRKNRIHRFEQSTSHPKSHVPNLNADKKSNIRR